MRRASCLDDTPCYGRTGAPMIGAIASGAGAGAAFLALRFLAAFLAGLRAGAFFLAAFLLAFLAALRAGFFAFFAFLAFFFAAMIILSVSLEVRHSRTVECGKTLRAFAASCERLATES